MLLFKMILRFISANAIAFGVVGGAITGLASGFYVVLKPIIDERVSDYLQERHTRDWIESFGVLSGEVTALDCAVQDAKSDKRDIVYNPGPDTVETMIRSIERAEELALPLVDKVNDRLAQGPTTMELRPTAATALVSDFARDLENATVRLKPYLAKETEKMVLVESDYHTRAIDALRHFADTVRRRAPSVATCLRVD